MELRSLEEFDRAFFARYQAAQHGGNPYDLPARAPADGPVSASKQTPVQRACAIFSWVIIAVLAIAIMASVAHLPFRAQMLSVQTGSMQPDYPIGSLLWVFPTKFEKIDVGDDVTYNTGGENITHRVIAIDRENRTLTTQGIHNSEVKETVSYSAVVGVVRFHINKLGGVMDKLNGETGIYIKATIVLAFFLLAIGAYLLSKAGSSPSPRHDNQTSSSSVSL